MNAGLTFDPEAHVYRFNGEVVPSVTQILASTGISVDFESLGSMSGEVRQAIELKREIGTALHADAHAFDDNDLDVESVDPRVRPYLDAWIEFRVNKGLLPSVRERRVFHPTMRYAGTLDGIFTTPSGARVLVDIKTGDPESSGCQFQTAAYDMAYEVMTGESVAERWGVQLVPGLRIPYRITKYDDWRDRAQWQSIVATFYAQHARRRSA